MKAQARCDIVIVNWNSGRFLRECLDSVVAHGELAGKIVVVDNDSSDGSDEAAAAPGLDVELVRAGGNLGFAKACNIGAALCSSPYVLFLNPDARLLEGSLERALAFMESDEAKGIGICGVRLIDEAGQVQQSCMNFPALNTFVGQATGLDRLFPGRFTRLVADFDYRESRPVDQVIGAFFLVRTSLFRALGGFDERFFVYFEELDFSLRARRAGWISYYLAEASAFHFGGGVTDRVKALRLFFVLRSRLLYGFKHFRRVSAWALVATTFLIEPLTRLARAAGRRSWEDLRSTVRGYRLLVGALPSILRTARRDG